MSSKSTSSILLPVVETWPSYLSSCASVSPLHKTVDNNCTCLRKHYVSKPKIFRIVPGTQVLSVINLPPLPQLHRVPLLLSPLASKLLKFMVERSFMDTRGLWARTSNSLRTKNVDICFYFQTKGPKIHIVLQMREPTGKREIHRGPETRVLGIQHYSDAIPVFYGPAHVFI